MPTRSTGFCVFFLDSPGGSWENNDMKIRSLALAALWSFGASLAVSAADDYKTLPVNTAEVEARYTAVIERRAADILAALDMNEDAKATEVRAIIINQYRALRARDAIIDTYLKAQEQNHSTKDTERQELLVKLTKPMHQLYVESLAAYLTPEQVEIVKDRVTYNKRKVMFDAYCEMFPNLTETEKATIANLLKAAREQAMDGGSAQEKHAIFDEYKRQINISLKAGGYDVDKAFQDWESKKNLSSNGDSKAGSNTD